MTASYGKGHKTDDYAIVCLHADGLTGVLAPRQRPWKSEMACGILRPRQRPTLMHTGMRFPKAMVKKCWRVTCDTPPTVGHFKFGNHTQ